MEQLRTLSNLDKHRTLTAVATAIAHEAVGIPEGVDVTWRRYGTNRPLGAGDTHVSTFVATSESGVEDMSVEPHFAYEVRLEGQRVDPLRGIAHEVYRVLYECETGQPLSPFAPYPLS